MAEVAWIEHVMATIGFQREVSFHGSPCVTVCKQLKVAGLLCGAFVTTDASAAQHLALVVAGDLDVITRAIQCDLSVRRLLPAIKAKKRFWSDHTLHRLVRVISRADFFAGLTPKTQPSPVVPSHDCRLEKI